MSLDILSNRRRIQERLGAGEADWQSWRWQMKNRVKTADALAALLPRNDEQLDAIGQAGESFRFAATPYYLSLIDPKADCDPIALQAIPQPEELHDPDGEPDPLCELDHSPVHDLIHVYPDRVALCITNVCQMYCRHCFRKRRVHESPPKDAFDKAIEYLEAHKEIRDVLVTGGDPLILEDSFLIERLRRIRAIEHVEIIRLGTRAPCTLPMRVNLSLVEKLKALHPIFVNVQFNHPRELTRDAIEALSLFVDNGFPIGNQSVLLKGINDDLPTMQALVHALLKARVRPYYIFHPQLIEGTAHLRVSLERGLAIHEGLEGFTSGLAVPLYILDTPYGKVPLTKSRIIERDEAGFSVRGFKGHIWREKNPKA